MTVIGRGYCVSRNHRLKSQIFRHECLLWYRQRHDHQPEKNWQHLQFISGSAFLTSVDSNARSTCWHDVITNSRGRQMEDYLSANHLHILNEDSDNTTFENRRGKSNIDLTIVNKAMLSRTTVEIQWPGKMLRPSLYNFYHATKPVLPNSDYFLGYQVHCKPSFWR